MAVVRDFSKAVTRERVARAITEIEAKSAAEVVVAVRPSSGHYRHSDYLVGFGFSLVSLLTFLFHPLPMRVDLYVAEFVAVFVIGTALSAWIAPLRRALTSRRLLADNVRRAARATFVELGVSRTQGRSGVLVYVSLFERRIEVVADIGIDPEVLAEAPFAPASSPERLLAGLSALGAVLARVVPRQSDDIDELPNALST